MREKCLLVVELTVFVVYFLLNFTLPFSVNALNFVSIIIDWGQVTHGIACKMHAGCLEVEHATHKAV